MIPPPPFLSVTTWTACEVEVRYPPPPPQKGVSQRYLHGTLQNKATGMQDPPLRCYLERVLRDMGGISHWAAKDVKLSAPKSQRFLAICDCDAHRGPQKSRDLPDKAILKAMLHCDLKVRWKVASDLRFRAAISEPKTPSFCGISGDLVASTRKSLAIASVRSWCAKDVK